MSDTWFAQAACRGKDTERWFPGRGDLNQHHREALLICQGCPVRVDCLEYAIANNEQHGIWGGVPLTERRAIRHRRGISTPAHQWRLREPQRAVVA